MLGELEMWGVGERSCLKRSYLVTKRQKLCEEKMTRGCEGTKSKSNF